MPISNVVSINNTGSSGRPASPRSTGTGNLEHVQRVCETIARVCHASPDEVLDKLAELAEGDA